MEINSYLNRVKSLIPYGVLIGAIFGFFSPLIFTTLLVLGFLILSFAAGPGLPSDSNLDSYAIAGGFILCMATMIPSTIIGVISGASISSVLAIWDKKVADVSASVIGFVSGVIIMAVVNYFIWSNNYLGAVHTNSFLEFIFPIKKDFIQLAITENPFLIPSIIAVLLSALGAWWINRKTLPKNNTD